MKEKLIGLIKQLASSHVTIGKLSVSKLAIVSTCAAVSITGVAGVGTYAVYQMVTDNGDKVATEQQIKNEESGLDDTGNLNEEKTEEVVKSEGITQSEDGSFIDKDGNKLTENADGTLTTASGTVVKKDTLTTVISKPSTGGQTSNGETSNNQTVNTPSAPSNSNQNVSTPEVSQPVVVPTPTPEVAPPPTPGPTPSYAVYTNLISTMGAYALESGTNWNKTDDMTSRFCGEAQASFFQNEAIVAANQLAYGANHNTLANAMRGNVVNSKYLITDVKITNYITDYSNEDFSERKYEDVLNDFRSQGMYNPTGFVSAAASLRYDNINYKFEGHLIVISFKEI